MAGSAARRGRLRRHPRPPGARVVDASDERGRIAGADADDLGASLVRSTTVVDTVPHAPESTTASSS